MTCAFLPLIRVFGSSRPFSSRALATSSSEVAPNGLAHSSCRIPDIETVCFPKMHRFRYLATNPVSAFYRVSILADIRTLVSLYNHAAKQRIQMAFFRKTNPKGGEQQPDIVTCADESPVFRRVLSHPNYPTCNAETALLPGS